MNQSRRDSGQVVKEPGKPALGKSVPVVLMDVGVPAELEHLRDGREIVALGIFESRGS